MSNSTKVKSGSEDRNALQGNSFPPVFSSRGGIDQNEQTFVVIDFTIKKKLGEGGGYRRTLTLCKAVQLSPSLVFSSPGWLARIRVSVAVSPVVAAEKYA